MQFTFSCPQLQFLSSTDVNFPACHSIYDYTLQCTLQYSSNVLWYKSNNLFIRLMCFPVSSFVIYSSAVWLGRRLKQQEWGLLWSFKVSFETTAHWIRSQMTSESCTSSSPVLPSGVVWRLAVRVCSVDFPVCGAQFNCSLPPAEGREHTFDWSENECISYGLFDLHGWVWNKFLHLGRKLIYQCDYSAGSKVEWNRVNFTVSFSE